jgi:UV excision repair protein RAD23
MGFPEAEALACLRAAQGNPDVAVEFLTNGIPPTVQSTGGTRGNNDTSSAPAGNSGNSSAPLSALRNHPQFDQLRALVQSNPQSLQAVLTQIGEQQPDLLTEINANQPLFLQMMNEPVSENPSPAGSSNSGAPTGGGSRLGRMLGGGANPAQMAQMLSSMNPTELNEMAGMMGLTPAQLTATAQMIGQMPPEQFQEFVTQAMNQEGGMGAGALGGLGGLGGPRQHILRLTEEEMAAVDRLTEMGFDRSEAAQAFLACDKNEALAANLLMDGGFGGQDGGFGGQDGGAGATDDTEDMYD